MTRLVRMLTLVALGSALVACDRAPVDTPTASPTAPSPSASPGDLAVPPLRLPSVAPDGTCPAAEPQRWSKPGQAQRVLGPGPVHPIADYFSGGALPLRPSDRQADGSYTVKVRWLAADYTGPVLVRAGRIDAPGAASAQFSYLGEPRHDGHHAVLTRPDTDLPGSTTVDGPGCYAYQVDGTSFSYTIVFRAG
ncbi:hypothetical protein [Micromonospora gifhornensis]|uniref:hypothetical protein n=1 Tax=Micromonospora gifhornensis TaxID=84594 RepID=UPI00365647C1